MVKGNTTKFGGGPPRAEQALLLTNTGHQSNSLNRRLQAQAQRKDLSQNGYG